MNNLYKILEVAITASQNEITASFRRLAMKHHPNRNADNPSPKILFQRINQAYEIIGSTEKRENYDKHGASFFELNEDDFLSNTIVDSRRKEPFEQLWFDGSNLEGLSEKSAFNNKNLQTLIAIIMATRADQSTEFVLHPVEEGYDLFQIMIGQNSESKTSLAMVVVSKDFKPEKLNKLEQILMNLGWGKSEISDEGFVLWVEREVELERWWTYDAADFLTGSMQIVANYLNQLPTPSELRLEVCGLEDHSFYKDLSAIDKESPWSGIARLLFLGSAALYLAFIMLGFARDWWDENQPANDVEFGSAVLIQSIDEGADEISIYNLGSRSITGLQFCNLTKSCDSEGASECDWTNSPNLLANHEPYTPIDYQHSRTLTLKNDGPINCFSIKGWDEAGKNAEVATSWYPGHPYLKIAED